MARLIENFVPVVKYSGLNTNKNVALGGTLAVTGATSFTVAPTGPRLSPVVNSALVGATVALTAAQSGGVFVNRSTSGTPSWTLPTLADGLRYTFVTGSTTAGFTVTGAQTIQFKTSATGTALTSTTTLTNTQGTAVVGDTITIVGDATSNTWKMISQTGIFAAS